MDGPRGTRRGHDSGDRPAVPGKQRGDIHPRTQPDQQVRDEHPQGTPLCSPDRARTSSLLEETAPLLDTLAKLELGAAAIDIARLNQKFKSDGGDATLEEFLRAELAEVVGKRGADDRTSTDVVLYGFGRIGRLLARLLIEKAGGGHGLRLRAIAVRRGSDNDLSKRASLLRRDSVHGSFEGTIRVDQDANTITANGVQIQVIYSDNPATNRLHGLWHQGRLGGGQHGPLA